MLDAPQAGRAQRGCCVAQASPLDQRASIALPSVVLLGLGRRDYLCAMSDSRPPAPPLRDARPRVLAVDPDAPDSVETVAAIADAAAVLRGGGLVAFPTETVYGLGANALDADAVRRIFAAKGRPSFNPVIAHVADVDGARALAAAWPDAAARLAAAFWPGPLTLVLPKRAHVPDALTAGLPAVAIRVPAHPIAQALVRAAGLPIAAPSANRYTELSPTMAEHVVRGLGARVDLVLDGGPTSVGIESTVVDLTGVARGDGPPRLLRPGTLGASRLSEVLGIPLAAAEAVEGEVPRLAPGLVARHYAPRAAVWVFDPAERTEVAAQLAAWRVGHPAGRVGGVLLAPWGEGGPDVIDVLPGEPEGYARRLYAALHGIDAAGCEVVLVERPEGEGWEGVRDRLERAGG